MPKPDDTPENVEICLKNCKPCLTYPDAEGEALFCARGMSSAPKAKHGCNCGYCELRRKYGFTGTYFCVSGACE